MMITEVLAEPPHHTIVRDSELALVTDDARQCMVPRAPPEEPWERYARAGVSVIVVFLTLAFARFVSSVVVAGFARAGCPYVRLSNTFPPKFADTRVA